LKASISLNNIVTFILDAINLNRRAPPPDQEEQEEPREKICKYLLIHNFCVYG